VSAEAFPLMKNVELPIEGLGVFLEPFPSRAATRFVPKDFEVFVPPVRGDRLIG
jgi:hypothetical protein